MNNPLSTQPFNLPQSSDVYESECAHMDSSQRAPFPFSEHTALVVNSDFEEQRRIQEFFERAQYHSLFANNVDDAVELCRNYGGPIHLLVADEGMPGGAAWHLAELACRIRPGLMVLFLPAASIAGWETAAFNPRALWEVTQAISSRPGMAVN
jgi:DNA-binding response OmpR family regulator